MHFGAQQATSARARVALSCARVSQNVQGKAWTQTRAKARVTYIGGVLGGEIGGDATRAKARVTYIGGGIGGEAGGDVGGGLGGDKGGG